MGAAQVHDIETDETYVGETEPRPLVLAPDAVVVRRNGRLLAAVARRRRRGRRRLPRPAPPSTGALLDWALTVADGRHRRRLPRRPRRRPDAAAGRRPAGRADPAGPHLARPHLELPGARRARPRGPAARRTAAAGLPQPATRPRRTCPAPRRRQAALVRAPVRRAAGRAPGPVHADQPPRRRADRALQDLAAGSTLVVEPLPVLEVDGRRDRGRRDRRRPGPASALARPAPGDRRDHRPGGRQRHARTAARGDPPAGAPR